MLVLVLAYAYMCATDALLEGRRVWPGQLNQFLNFYVIVRKRPLVFGAVMGIYESVFVLFFPFLFKLAFLSTMKGCGGT